MPIVTRIDVWVLTHINDYKPEWWAICKRIVPLSAKSRSSDKYRLYCTKIGAVKLAPACHYVEFKFQQIFG